MSRLGLLTALAAAIALAVPAAASAHAVLDGSNPAPGQRLEVAPRTIELRFSGPVKVLSNSIQVLSSTGQLFSGKPRLGETDRVVVVDLLDLPKDGYTVRWRTLSALDGHLVSGVFTFGVRYPAPPATAAYGTEGPGVDEQIIRWVYFTAIALLAGGLAFRLVVLRGLEVPPRLHRALLALTGGAVVVAIEIGIVGFLLRSINVLQVPFGDFLYGDLSPLANGTRFGQAFIALTLGYVVVTALIVFTWLSGRLWPLWPALVLTLGFAAGLPLSGHSTEDTYAAVSVIADWVHLSAASLWVGGLATLALLGWRLAPELRRVMFLRFSRLATVLVALVIGPGIYLAFRRLPEVSDLWETDYGKALIVKLVLVAAALAWGAFHHLVARPVVRGAGRDGFVARLQRSLLGESTVICAALLLAAILVNSEPPVEKKSTPASPAAAVAPAPGAPPRTPAGEARP